ncbi:MAG: hypothetical protein LLF83_08380 [Methanobacterium sp.]|nr:hypothetical protein [Methanobacterium sp.]
MVEYYKYYHQDTSIDTVEAFLSEPTSIARYFNGKESQFLDISDEMGVRNRDRIWGKYLVDIERDFYLQIYPDADSVDKFAPLLINTLLIIPKDQANNEMLSILGENILQESQNFNCFVTSEMYRLFNDKTYIKADVINIIGNNSKINIINQFLQVWIALRGTRIINVTPFVQNITISVGDTGAFSFSLSPIADIERTWGLGQNRISVSNVMANGNFFEPYFSQNIQQNDIVFISFEKLSNEKNRDIDFNPFIEKGRLPNQIYDMIGLVDECSVSYNGMSGDVGINVKGRDLSKVLIEDGSYFLPYVLMENSKDFFVNLDQNSKFFKRTFVKEYQGIFFQQLKSIRECLGFIFNQLSNTGFIPTGTDLFSSYSKDKISKTYQINNATSSYLKSVEQNGVWKIIKLLVDNGLDDKRVVNGDISNPNGTLLEEIKKICQDPFVEFWGDTWGDTYTFIARTPPFTGDQIKDYLKNYLVIEIGAEVVSSFSFSWETEYYSWYKLEAQNNFLGNDDFTSASIVPIVYLQQYIDAFGNHKKVVPCNYMSFRAITGNGYEVDRNRFINSYLADLKYAIDSTFYLPFTRRGSIVIKGGDRRIKRGMFIYFKPTNEVFYVNGVSNTLRTSNSDIDRETILTVSRGMVRDYIEGAKSFGNTYSYFDIVNSDSILAKIESITDLNLPDGGTLEGGVNVTVTRPAPPIVNSEVFTFFLNRGQTPTYFLDFNV